MRIQLNDGYSIEVDEADFKRVRAKKWRARVHEGGTVRITTATGGPNNCTTEHLGRFILQPRAGERVILLVRPKIGKHFDYRRQNLRVGGQREARLSSVKHLGKTSIYKGVSFDRDAGRWRACIKVAGKSIFLGKYDCEREAARAYDRAARKHFAEFAYQNFPDSSIPNEHSGDEPGP